MKEIVFFGLPKGKINGFCERPEENSDGGSAVSIDEDCSRCQVGQCHMFQAILSPDGAVIARVFIPHSPKY